MINALTLLSVPTKWLRGLYDWTIGWSKTKSAPVALFGIALAEASFFPIPPDVLLIPMVIADQKRWWKIASICTLGSVTGAVIGYGIGWGLYETIGQPIVNAYHLQEMMHSVGTKYEANAFLTILTAAFTPIPFKVITIAAGLFKIGLPIMFIAAVVGRAGRFFLVAGLIRMFGEKISGFIEKYFDLVSLAFFALLIGGFLAIKYL